MQYSYKFETLPFLKNKGNGKTYYGQRLYHMEQNDLHALSDDGLYHPRIKILYGWSSKQVLYG